MLGPVLLEFGSEQQKRDLLTPMARRGALVPGILRARCGFLTPAKLKTSARDEGDHFVVNGTKIWTSYGDKSDWMYALVRTRPERAQASGHQPDRAGHALAGQRSRPIDLISGKSAFCQVFFDNVKVPKSQLIGPLNGGWTLGKSLLQHERKAMSKFGETSLPNHFHLLPLVERYLPEPRSAADQALRARALGAAMDEHAYALTVQRMGEEARSGQDISGPMAIMKLVHSEQERDKFEILLDTLGYHALGPEGDAFSGEELAITKAWLNGFAMTIAGGASEVQLNVIAKWVLGLPDAKPGTRHEPDFRTEEQRLLADTAREFLAARSPVAAQRRLRDEARAARLRPRPVERDGRAGLERHPVPRGLRRPGLRLPEPRPAVRADRPQPLRQPAAVQRGAGRLAAAAGR